MNEEVIRSILKNKLIVIVRNVAKEKLLPLSEALYDGGIRLMEITYSANGTVSDEETADSIRQLTEHWKDGMQIGAGTVLTPEQVVLTQHAGGRFIISPNTDRAVIEKTKELGLISIPGAMTPSEIQQAHTYGADFVKVFPVTGLGSAYIKAVAAPLSHIQLLAVGGINENNMAEYLKAGACGFGIGANLVNQSLIASNRFDKITELAKLYVAGVAQ